MPINIFFCSVQEDENLLKELKSHLRLLEKTGLIRFWYDRGIRKGGDRWRSQVMCHLNTAQIVLVLVSANFLDSDYCYDFEMKHALKRGNCRVIPIILRPVYWRLGPLARLEPLPTDGKAVTGPSWRTSDEAFENIAEGIHKLVEQWQVVPLPIERLSVLRTLNHESPVVDMAISADGYVLVSGSKDGSMKVWKRSADEPADTLTGHTGAVRRVAISPDGQTLVSGGDDGTIRVWDLFRGKQTRLLQGHEGPVECVAISADEQTLICGSADQTIRVWDLSTGEIKCTFRKNSGPVYCVAISANGRTMVSGSADGMITVWDMTRLEEQEGALEEVKTLTGHKDKVSSIAICADGLTLISGSKDGTSRIWNLSKDEVFIIDHKGPVSDVAMSPDEQAFFSGSTNAEIHVAVAMSPDEQMFFSGSTNGKIHVWNRSIGRVVKTFDHESAVTTVIISIDGKTLVSANNQGKIKVWGERVECDNSMTLD
jgi:hypothetical protein